MLISAYSGRALGMPTGQAPLAIERQDDMRAFSSRILFMAGKPAYELSLWCGTCPFLFERKEGANGTLSAEVEVLEELEGSIDAVSDHLLAPFSSLLPEGDYLPLLLEVRPELVSPGVDRDYFANEQVATWGVDSFWGLPENPRCFYYRGMETSVRPGGHLYEFIVPMVPPAWNDHARVEHYRDVMRKGVTPTAVALTTLDVCQPAIDDQSTDYYAHWGLTHFLLDGHHKMEAAASAGSTVQLLALVSCNDSLATADEIARLPELLAQPSGARSRKSM